MYSLPNFHPLLNERTPMESVENPSAVVTTDYPIIINVMLWITACVLLIYFKGQIPFLH